MARRRKSKRPDSGVSGAVVLDKPAGCTSHDVVDKVRAALGTRKVGHAGTLDPDATGILVLGVGLGTKLLEFVTGTNKTYEGDITFGTETNTLDASGEITGCHEMHLDPSQVSEASLQFLGDIEQIPPMVSAVKVDGQRLHNLARQGVEVERKPRPVQIGSFDLEPTENPLLYRFKVECSSGTYVRTLAADLGHALGGGAHLSRLVRTHVGPYSFDDACTIDAVELLPLEVLTRGMAVVDVDEVVASQVSNGRSLGPSAGAGRIAVRGPSQQLLAIYEARDGELRPAKVFVGSN